MTRAVRHQRKLIAKGLCSICGKNPLHNKVRCKECIHKQTVRQRIRRQEVREREKEKLLNVPKIDNKELDRMFETKFEKIYGEEMRRYYA
jgi:hypothetical protein